jgi:hypothetical protein
MKYETKKVIIRESDLSKVDSRLIWKHHRYVYAKTHPQWQIKTVEPITQAWCEKKVTWATLKNRTAEATVWRHWPWPNDLLNRLGKKMMWDNRYENWLVRWVDADTLEIRAGLNQPRSRLMWAVLERGDKDTNEEDPDTQ